MVDGGTDRIASARTGSARREEPRAALTPSLERRNSSRRAVWYAILAVLIVAGLMLPFVFGS